MSDLRVTDVQAALRHFATIGGHDVLTNPRAVRLTPHPGSSREEPSEYGLVVGHELSMDYGDWHGDTTTHTNNFLKSYIMQSERPLISTITSGSSSAKGEDQKSHSRNVSFIVPQTVQFNYDKPVEHDFSPAYMNRNGLLGTVFTRDSNFKSNSFPKFTTNNGKDSRHPDIFHALESHKTKDVSDLGVLYTPQAQKRDMTSEDMSAFNSKEAIHRLTNPAAPFSNLIVVRHKRDSGATYTYNHETEELHRHE
jgi:hypothetical protein